MYISYVRPKLEYGSMIWDDCSEFDKIRLENIQLQCARIISGAKRGTSAIIMSSGGGWGASLARMASSVFLVTT